MINAALGLDVGNGTIKVVLLSEEKEVIDHVYLKNRGIIETIKKAFKSLKKKNDVDFTQ